MYEYFFGLMREPFSIAPDPRFLYMSDKHREALAHLTVGLRGGGGFVLLTGEIGAGKTTVWRRFLEQLPADFDVACVVNPKLGVAALLKRICEDLRVELPADASEVDPIDAIHGQLLLAHASGRRAVIVVDEAQALSTEVLEQLRLLTNLVTGDRKLVQVLLIGQPELRTMLEQRALEPLAQRVVARFHLPALSEPETAGYVAHRLAVAGLVGGLPFDAAALSHIHRLCGGVPRRINVLCDRALLHAHAAESRRVETRMIDHAAGEVFGRSPLLAAMKPVALPAVPAAAMPTMPPAWQPGPTRWPRWLALTGVTGGALAAGLLLAPRLAPAPVRATAMEAVPAPAPVSAPAPAPAPASTPESTFDPVPSPARVPVPELVAAMPAAPLTAAGLDALFSPGAVDEATAWRALAEVWGVSLGAGEPCALAPKQALHCFRSRGGLGSIRQLDRPGIVRLADGRGRVSHVLLTGLSDASATVRIGGADQGVPLEQLARVWRGDFAALWRAPPRYREADLIGAAGPLAPWLGQRLALIDGIGSAPVGNEALRARLFAFQIAHDLEPDGLAGPLTLMRINQVSGIAEPRLNRRP